jgi:hypothetical protein
MRFQVKLQRYDQLVLDLSRGTRTLPPVPAPEELLQALADLLLEAFDRQNNDISVVREVCDASEDHT